MFEKIIIYRLYGQIDRILITGLPFSGWKHNIRITSCFRNINISITKFSHPEDKFF
jgi:hypothetical protein